MVVAGRVIKRFLAAVLVAAAPVLSLVETKAGETPEREIKTSRRVVSLDYCADQYVLHFVDRDRIAALSPDAGKPFSFYRDKAVGVRQVAPRAETILAMQPDLVVRSYGGGPKAVTYFQQAGIRVVQLPNAQRLADIPAITRQIGTLLGAPQKAEATARHAEAALARPTVALGETLLYMTPGGLTAGRGTLMDDLIRHAGYDNYETGEGWRTLPLEKLVREPPNRVVYASFGAGYADKNKWSASRHPVAQALPDDRRTSLSGAVTSCGAWFMLDALKILAAPAGKAEHR
ncbi:MAG: ABC transporter substrate-binding protein [Parvibaculales bacterium]